MNGRVRDVVWCIDSPGFGGSERDFIRLVERGVPRPDLVVCGPAVAPELRAFLDRSGIPTRTGTQRNDAPSAFSGLLRAARLLLSNARASFVVWGHHADSNRWLQLALAVAGRRFVLAERGVPASAEPFRGSRLSVPIKRLVMSRAQRVVLNGYSQEAHYVSLFDGKPKVRVIPNSRDTAGIAEEVRRRRASKVDACRALGVSAASVILSVLRLSQEKGARDLIEAVSRLSPSERQAVRLVLVGDGPELDGLRSQAATVAPGIVTFAGWQSDPIPWLAAADVFVLPSLSEGLPGALIEAMAAGLPCIATDIPGNRELIVHGKTGLLAPPNAPAELSKAMATLLRDRALAGRLAEAGRSLVCERYDERDEIEAWRTVLADLAAYS